MRQQRAELSKELPPRDPDNLDEDSHYFEALKPRQFKITQEEILEYSAFVPSFPFFLP